MEVDAGSRPPAAVLTEPPSATRCEIRGWNCVNALFTSLRGCCVWGKRGRGWGGVRNLARIIQVLGQFPQRCATRQRRTTWKKPSGLFHSSTTVSFSTSRIALTKDITLSHPSHDWPRKKESDDEAEEPSRYTHTEKGSQPLGRFTWILFFLSPLPSFLPSPSSSHDRLGPFLSWYWQKRVAGWCLTSIERDAWERKHHPLFGPRQYWGRWKAYMDQSPFSMFNCHRERDAPFVPWPEEWVQARGGAPDSSATLIDSSIIPAQRHRIDSTLFWSSRNAG